MQGQNGSESQNYPHARCLEHLGEDHPRSLEKERGQYVEKLVGMSRYVGELESHVLQLGGAPRGDRTLPHGAEGFGKMPQTEDAARETESFPQGGVAL